MDPIQAISGAADAALQAVRALLGDPAPNGGPGQEPGPVVDPSTAPPRTGSEVVGPVAMTAPMVSHELTMGHPAAVPVEAGRSTLAQLAAQGSNPHGAVAQHAPLTSDVTSAVAQRTAATNSHSPMPSAGSGHASNVEAPTPARSAGPATAAATSTPSLSMHAIRPEAAAAFERATDAVLLASQVSSLHTQPSQMQRMPAVPTREEPSKRSRHESWQEADWLEEHDRHHHADSPQPEVVIGEAPESGSDDTLPIDDPDFASLHQRLVEAQQHAALRELEQRRCVLLVVPAASIGPGRSPARAHLLSGAKATSHAFAARWWPGAPASADWSGWRLHREGDGPRWRSRSTERERGAAALLLRLAPPSHSLLEAAGACLDIGDARRFRHALGGQWSVLALLCPAWSPQAVHEQQRHDVS